jgi:hypothetical protein
VLEGLEKKNRILLHQSPFLCFSWDCYDNEVPGLGGFRLEVHDLVVRWPGCSGGFFLCFRLSIYIIEERELENEILFLKSH